MIAVSELPGHENFFLALHLFLVVRQGLGSRKGPQFPLATYTVKNKDV